MACVRSKKGRKCRKDGKSNSALLEWWDGEDDQIHRILLMIVMTKIKFIKFIKFSIFIASPPL